MEFTRYIWQLYADSDNGRAALAKPAESFLCDRSSDDMVLHMPVLQRNSEEDYAPIENRFVDSNVRNDVCTWCSQESVESPEDARSLFTSIVDEAPLIPAGQEDGHELFYCFAPWETYVFSNIEAYSLGLHDVFPDHFVPFLFSGRFDQFSAVCDKFNIPISKPPGKTQARDRALYYLAVNEALQEFRRKHKLTPPELVAFLYDFAPRVVATERDTELPAPSRVWFTMGGINSNGDFDFLDQADASTTARWQGNIGTRRGDIILMWCVSPRSYLHSIWRAIDDGFADPFFYFYSSIRIGNFTKVPPVSFKEFADDPVLSLNKSVKAHFQGAGGKPFPLEDYLVLLDMLKGKGCDVSSLPSPPAHVFDFPDLENERDVEIHLVEPFLRHLGYAESDWLRQMPIRMGRGERNFPDYCIEPNPKRGEESATFLIETKYELATKRQLEDAYIQGKSYALRLQTRAFALAAREGIWLYSESNGFSSERFWHWTWKEIEHPDRFHEVSALLAKGNMAAGRARRRPHSSPATSHIGESGDKRTDPNPA